MNEVGRSHFLLKNSDLSEKKVGDIKLHFGGALSQYPAIRGLLLRMGKQDQSQHHNDWTLYADPDDQGNDSEFYEIWYEAYEIDDYEWGWTDEEGWSATQDGEWYYMVDDDTWLPFVYGEYMDECTIDGMAVYWGKSKSRSFGRGRGFSRGKGKERGKGKSKNKGKRFNSNPGNGKGRHGGNSERDGCHICGN